MQSFGKDGMELHDPTAVWFAMENKIGKPLAQGWKIEKREFVVERYVLPSCLILAYDILLIKFDFNREGEFTRGMCVVDRRNNKKAGHGSKFGKSMAELKQEEETPSTPQPAPVQVDKPSQASLKEGKGVNVIVKTPGSEALVERMLKDIWGA